MTQSNVGPAADGDSSIVVALRCLLLFPFILFRDTDPLEFTIELPISMSFVLMDCRLLAEVVGDCNIDSGIGLL